MTAAQINCFIATADNMSFSKAANKIFLSQSAVSRHVIMLEKELGTQLFVRAGKCIYLTEAGKVFYEFFTRTNTEFAELKSRFSPEPSVVQSLSYAVLPIWNITDLLEENAHSIACAHPDWELSMKFCGVSKILSDLRSGNVDVILHSESQLSEMRGVLVRPLGVVEYILLFSGKHPMAAKTDPAPWDFAGDDFFYVADNLLPQERVFAMHDRFEARYGFKPKLVGLDDAEALSIALESGRGVSLLSRWNRPGLQKDMRSISLDFGEHVALGCLKNSPCPIAAQFMNESAEFLTARM